MFIGRSEQDQVYGAIRELLEWVDFRPRSYQEAMDSWRSTCPRHSTWEDASIEGLVEERDGLVLLTGAGRSALNGAAKDRG